MGLWIKNADGTIERAAGGGGGTFDGDHVLTGDPLDPPADLAAGQLLWDGVEGGSGGGGDAGPHDHDYLPLTGGTLTGDLTVDGRIQASAGSTAYPALAIGNSSTGFHIDESAGGLTTALNGAWKQIVYEDLIRIRKDLHVDGTETRLRDRISMRSSSEDGSRIDYEQKTDQDKKWITSGPRESDDNSFIFEWYDSGWTRTLALWKDRARFYGDLQVDGHITTGPGKAVYFGGNWDGGRIFNTTAAGREYMIYGNLTDGGTQMTMYGPGDPTTPGYLYMYSGGAITARFDPDHNTKLYGNLQVDGELTVDGNQPLLLRSTDGAGREYVQFHAGPSAMTMYGGNDANYPNEVRFESNRLLALSIDGTKKVRAYGDLQVDGTINGTLAFGIAEDIDTADVLDRAETATMPAIDAEGIATTDAESITVNEVMTAMLAKIKELSARIEELEGA